jgi:hypothetical protein
VLSVHIPKTALPQPRKIEIGRRTQGQMSSGTPAGQKQVNASKAPAEEPRSAKPASRETANV